MTGARRAGVDDLATVVDVLVASHLDYVWERWALPGEDRRSHLEALFAADLRRFGLPLGEVWMTEDGASAAVWMQQGAFTLAAPAAADEAATVALAAFGDRLAIVDDVDAHVRRARPPADWYLATMGTLPAAQRRGLGTAGLAPRLGALDATGQTATLETSDAGNLGFYGRLGFEVVATLDALPHGAPTTWVMRRRGTAPHSAAHHG